MTDVFISHASEDKDAVARPIAAALQARGFDVWYDEYSLRLGDSLREAIDRGLAQCRYGVVILSPSFFAKSWTQKELDGLIARETGEGTKRILPVWHNLNAQQVAAVSPTLAGRFAINTGVGIEHVIDTIVRELTETSTSDTRRATTETRRATTVPAPTRAAVNIPPGYERRLNAIRFDVASGRDPRTGKPVPPEAPLTSAQQSEIAAGRAVLISDFCPARLFGIGMIVPRLRLWNVGKHKASSISLHVNGDSFGKDSPLVSHGDIPYELRSDECVEFMLKPAVIRALSQLVVEAVWKNEDGSDGHFRADFAVQPF